MYVKNFTLASKYHTLKVLEKLKSIFKDNINLISQFWYKENLGGKF